MHARDTHTHALQATHIFRIQQAVLPKVNTKQEGQLDGNATQKPVAAEDEGKKKKKKQRRRKSVYFTPRVCWWLSSVWARDYLFISCNAAALRRDRSDLEERVGGPRRLEEVWARPRRRRVLNKRLPWGEKKENYEGIRRKNAGELFQNDRTRKKKRCWGVTHTGQWRRRRSGVLVLPHIAALYFPSVARTTEQNNFHPGERRFFFFRRTAANISLLLCALRREELTAVMGVTTRQKWMSVIPP